MAVASRNSFRSLVEFSKKEGDTGLIFQYPAFTGNLLQDRGGKVGQGHCAATGRSDTVDLS